MQNPFRSGPMALLIAIGAPVAAQTALADALHWQSMNGIVQANNVVGTGSGAVTGGGYVCDTDGSASGGNSTLVDTPLVDLDDEGDARFDGVVGTLPPVCASEPDVAFLIRIGSGRWIANATVLR